MRPFRVHDLTLVIWWVCGVICFVYGLYMCKHFKSYQSPIQKLFIRMLMIIPIWAIAGMIMLSYSNDRVLLRSAQVALMLSLSYAMVSYYSMIHVALGGRKQIIAHYYRIWDARAQRSASRRGLRDDHPSSMPSNLVVNTVDDANHTNKSLADSSKNGIEIDDDDEFDDDDYGATIGYTARELLETQGSFFTGNVIRAEVIAKKHLKDSDADNVRTEDLILGDEDLWWATLGDLEADLSLKPGYVASGLSLLKKPGTDGRTQRTRYHHQSQNSSSKENDVSFLEPLPFTQSQLLEHQVPPGYGTLHSALYTNRDPRHYTLFAAKGYCFRSFFSCCCTSLCLRGKGGRSRGQEEGKSAGGRGGRGGRTHEPKRSLLYSAAPSYWHSDLTGSSYDNSSEYSSRQSSVLSDGENDDVDSHFDHRGGLLPFGRWTARTPKSLYRFHTIAAHQTLIVGFIISVVLVLLAVYKLDQQLVVVLLKSCLMVSLLISALASHMLATIFAPSLVTAELGTKSHIPTLVILVAIQDVVLSCIVNSGYLAPTASASGQVVLRVSTFLLMGEAVLALLIALVWFRDNDPLVLKTSNDHLEHMDYHTIILECQREADFLRAIAEATGGALGKDIGGDGEGMRDDDFDSRSKDMFLALSFQKSVGSRLLTGSSISSTAQRSIWKAKAMKKAREELLGEFEHEKKKNDKNILGAAAISSRPLPREPYTNMGAVFQLFKFWDVLPYVATDRSTFRTHPAPSREVLRRFYFDHVYRMETARRRRLQARQIAASEKDRIMSVNTNIDEDAAIPIASGALQIDTSSASEGISIRTPASEFSDRSNPTNIVHLRTKDIFKGGSDRSDGSDRDSVATSPGVLSINPGFPSSPVQRPQSAAIPSTIPSGFPKAFSFADDGGASGMSGFVNKGISNATPVQYPHATMTTSESSIVVPTDLMGQYSYSKSTENNENITIDEIDDDTAMLTFTKRRGVYDDDDEDAILLNLGNAIGEP